MVVPSALRERQLGLLMQTFGFNPLGALLTGAVAAALGAATALTGGAALLLAFFSAVLWRLRLHWNESRDRGT